MLETNSYLKICKNREENSMMKITILGHNINFTLVKTWFLNKIHEKMDAGMH